MLRLETKNSCYVQYYNIIETLTACRHAVAASNVTDSRRL